LRAENLCDRVERLKKRPLLLVRAHCPRLRCPLASRDRNGA
jgi:hypothetical protein